jgi:hypothetical protein
VEKERELKDLKASTDRPEGLLEELTLEDIDNRRLLYKLADYDKDAVDDIFIKDKLKYPTSPEEVEITPRWSVELGSQVRIFHGQGKDHLSDEVDVRDSMAAASLHLGPFITKEIFFTPSLVAVGVELINAPGADSLDELSVLIEALDDADRVLVVTTNNSIKDTVSLHKLLERVLDRVYTGDVEIGFVVNQERNHLRSDREMLEEQVQRALQRNMDNIKRSTYAFFGDEMKMRFERARVKNKNADEQTRLNKLSKHIRDNNTVVISPSLYTSILTDEST